MHDVPTSNASSATNNLDLDALGRMVAAINAHPTQAKVQFLVKTKWTGQTRSESTVDSYVIGGKRVDRRFKIVADEPVELLGSNLAPNPQELLMSAINACMMVGYVAQATVRGITLDALDIEMNGELDLRGFLGLDEDTPPGYRDLRFKVRMRGNATPEQCEEIHQAVMRTSPNYFNMTRPIPMHGSCELV
jgi:uncharacterized OsmC-like protein